MVNGFPDSSPWSFFCILISQTKTKTPLTVLHGPAIQIQADNKSVLTARHRDSLRFQNFKVTDFTQLFKHSCINLVGNIDDIAAIVVHFALCNA